VQSEKFSSTIDTSSRSYLVIITAASYCYIAVQSFTVATTITTATTKIDQAVMSLFGCLIILVCLFDCLSNESIKLSPTIHDHDYERPCHFICTPPKASFIPFNSFHPLANKEFLFFDNTGTQDYSNTQNTSSYCNLKHTIIEPSN